MLSAYAVKGQFDLIERMWTGGAAGGAPGLRRRRTTAAAGQAILEVVADEAPGWFRSDAAGTSVAAAEGQLVGHVEAWLAVNGFTAPLA